MHPFLSHPITRGAIAGLIAAALVDFHAFLTWRKWQDLKAYDWGTATFRWAAGVVSGAMTAAGYNAVV